MDEHSITKARHCFHPLQATLANTRRRNASEFLLFPIGMKSRLKPSLYHHGALENKSQRARRVRSRTSHKSVSKDQMRTSLPRQRLTLLVWCATVCVPDKTFSTISAGRLIRTSAWTRYSIHRTLAKKLLATAAAKPVARETWRAGCSGVRAQA